MSRRVQKRVYEWDSGIGQRVTGMLRKQRLRRTLAGAWCVCCAESGDYPPTLAAQGMGHRVSDAFVFSTPLDPPWVRGEET